MNLLNLTVIGAAITTPLVSNPVKFLVAPRNLTIQANFGYGSGGTSVDGYVQTSVDGGLTWFDIANFHFTTSAAIKLFNLNSQTPETTAVTPLDGSMAANTCQDGLLGPQFRVKYKSAGTYSGATSLSIDIASDQVG